MPSGNRKKNEGKSKTNLKKKVAEVLELPKEIVLNIPKITIFGKELFVVENYKNILAYDNEFISINTSIGIVKITGKKLVIKGITSDEMLIDGQIISVELTNSK